MTRVTRLAFTTFFEYEESGARAYTDPISNTVVLDDVRLFERVAEFGEQGIPRTFLGPLLHEATHHMTFDSPVGLTLAAMACSPLGLRGPDDDANEERLPAAEFTMPVVDTITHRVVSRLFEPLVEGLALFAEHDLVPGDSAIVSRPTHVAALLFTRQPPGADPQSDLMRHHRVMVRSTRATAEFLESKERLLRQPLHERPSYLMGYLAVKALYRELAKRSPRVLDPDLFLVLMVDYWFGDHDLARLIGTPIGKPARQDDPDGTRTGGRVVAIVEYLQDRLDQLYAQVDRFSEECEAFVAGRTTTEPSYRGEAATGFVSLHEFLLVLRGVYLRMNAFFPRIFEHRQGFRFSSARAMVTIDAEREVVVTGPDGRLILRARAVKNATPGVYDGSVEGLVLCDTWQIAAGILAGDGLVAVLDVLSGEWNQPDFVERLDRMPSSADVEGVMHALDVARTEFSNDRARELLAKVEGEAERFIRFFYPKILYWGQPPAAREQIAALERAGFGGLLDAEQLAFVVQVSLLCGTMANVPFVAKVLGLSEEALLATVDAVNAIGLDHVGMPFFYTLDGHIFGLV